MYLKIDGRDRSVRPGESLHQLVGPEKPEKLPLSRRPLAAKIAGEVFTLNYVPLREKDLQTGHPFLRRAVAASGGEVQLLYYRDPLGRDCYIRTAQFVIFLALSQLWPEARGRISCTLGSSVYIQIFQAPDFSVEKLKQRFRELVEQDLPLIRRRVSRDTAIARYTAGGQTDKARLLQHLASGLVLWLRQSNSRFSESGFGN